MRSRSLSWRESNELFSEEIRRVKARHSGSISEAIVLRAVARRVGRTFVSLTATLRRYHWNLWFLGSPKCVPFIVAVPTYSLSRFPSILFHLRDSTARARSSIRISSLDNKQKRRKRIILFDRRLGLLLDIVVAPPYYGRLEGSSFFPASLIAGRVWYSITMRSFRTCGYALVFVLLLKFQRMQLLLTERELVCVSRYSI